VDTICEIKAEAVVAGIIHESPNYGYVEPVVARRMSKLRRDTHWARHEEWGWYLTPEGMAYLDGVLDQVVSLEDL
jgi:hypothetical protein